MTTTLVSKVVESRKIKTDCKNKKLKDRMKSVEDCLASRLLNGINHIWSDEINACRDDCSDNDGGQEDSFAALVARENAMWGIQVKETLEDRGNCDDEEIATSAEGSGDKPLPEFCVSCVYDAGGKTMDADNYIKVQHGKEARRNRKCEMVKFILKKVKEMEQESETTVGVEQTTVSPAPWTQLVHGLDPNYYN